MPTPISQDSVDVAFDLMLSEIERKVEDLNAEGAALFRNSAYDAARERADHGENLAAFKRKVEALRLEWVSDHSPTFPKSEPAEVEKLARTISSASKAPKTLLVVKFRDGETIFEKVAADTFVKSIKKFEFTKVMALGMEINRLPLVSRTAPERYSYTEESGFFISTHCSTSFKKELLDRIASELRQPISVNIVEA